MKENHTVISRELGRRLSKLAHMKGQKLVFTNGFFDILHVGHVKYLEEAKSLGDVLIVGINSDRSASVQKVGRPFVNQDDRAKIISTLYCVDYAIIFDEDTPIQLISELKPDIHVKGGNYYNIEDLPEFNAVISYGGKIQILSYTHGKSTTNIIKRIIKTYGGKKK